MNIIEVMTIRKIREEIEGCKTLKSIIERLSDQKTFLNISSELFGFALKNIRIGEIGVSKGIILYFLNGKTKVKKECEDGEYRYLKAWDEETYAFSISINGGIGSIQMNYRSNKDCKKQCQKMGFRFKKNIKLYYDSANNVIRS